ncbi:hypothetical protein V2J23_17270 [Geobacillus thermoleovorans]|uniref:hypothetical protein n=1 Tax=Geobacillus thermoleovorans TaxID=33941 RepID=UPI00345BCCBA
MNVNFEQRCKELYQEEVACFKDADIHIEHDYIIHENIRSLDIFILITELGSMIFIEYKSNKENLEEFERKQHIVGPDLTDVISRLVNHF